MPAGLLPLVIVLLGAGFAELWWISSELKGKKWFIGRRLSQFLYPGFSAQARRTAPFASVAVGIGAFTFFRSLAPGGVSLLCALLVAVVCPRAMKGLLSKPVDDVATARELLEAAEAAAAAGYTIRDALESMRANENDAANIALDVLADISHRVPEPVALRDAGEYRSPAVRRALRMLAVYVGRGHWGPEAVASLRQIRDTVEKRRRLTDSIRTATSAVRSLRMAIVIVIPMLTVVLFVQNRAIMVAYVRTSVGASAVLGCFLLYVLTITLSRWLIPDWGE